MKLEDPIGSATGIGPVYLKRLKKLGIKTIEDLLYHIPSRHIDFSKKVSIKDLKIGEQATVIGQVISAQNIYTNTGKIFQVVEVSDGVNKLEAIWTRNPWLIKSLPKGTFISLSGKLGFWGKKRAMMFPQWEKYSQQTVHTGRLVPVYPETAGITSKWLRRIIVQILEKVEIEDFLEESDLLDLKEAIKLVHKAEKIEDFQKAVKRLSFNELLMLSIESNLKKLWWRENTKAYSLTIKKKDLQAFYNSLSFKLTSAQNRAIDELLNDLKKEVSANRLLEGDVGSGKTIVAAAGMFTAFINSKKSVIMAPTQILAQQHFVSLKKILEPFKARVALVTSNRVAKDYGGADVIIGTHALLFNKNFVKDSAFLVIDEQHRFGVIQRAKITEHAQGEYTPHVLTMTATPIPRTIALTLYGDLDLSILDELPPGRKKISTWVIPQFKRKAAEKWIEKEILENSAQVFVVCPLIEESEAQGLLQVKAATKEFERLKKVYPNLSIGLIHGRMKAKEKDKVIADFREKKYHILVSTPVIEVGIDIPHATIMVIEAAERFGLATLHQLRGRVGRGDKKSYCLLFTESKSKKALTRLNAVTKTKTGKELAEIDLETRGPGELLGIRQSGASELKIAHWNDYELVKKARDYADKVIANQKRYKKVLSYYRKRQAAPN